MSCSDVSHIWLGPNLETQEEFDARSQKMADEIIHAVKAKRRLPMSVLRAKLKVTRISCNKNEKGEIDQETVELAAVYSSDPTSENAQWSKWTPQAQFSLTINNPEAFGKLSKGHEFFVDFTPVS